MPRPRRCRWVRFGPNVDFFKPRGIALSSLNTVNLNVEELEAIRLKDFENMDQTEAAKKMDVSQPTFHRILQEARKKVATALVEGNAIRIQGGVYNMPGGDQTGPLGQGPGVGAGRGRGRRGFGAPPMNCVCSSCGHTEAKQRGVPCASLTCPKCNSPMIRGN